MNEILNLKEETMSSLQIAEITGKRHSDVLEAIRIMEPAWVKIAQRKFPLGSYKDANQQDRPCYYLTKTECLYVATKFNDEARAKLVLRWEELEKANIASYQITDPIKRAQKWIEEEKQRQLLIEDNDKKEAQIKEDAPKVLFANCITGSKSSCLIGELAKILTVNGYKIGQNRLFEKLRKEHYLGTRGESYNIPNQQYVEQGLFDIRKRPQFVNGVSFVTTTIKVTGKGQQYFINKFIGALQPSLNM